MENEGPIRHKYYLNKRVKWDYYKKLVSALAELGIHEADLHPTFARFRWPDQKRYLERKYLWLFYCVRCHTPYNAEESRHPQRDLCIGCAATYEEKPEYVFDNDMSVQRAREERVRVEQDIIKRMAAKQGHTVEGDKAVKTATVEDILNIMKGHKPEATPDNGQHEQPLGVSKTDPQTSGPTEEESRDPRDEKL